MAQDISNKINEATNDVILQGKDIRNRIVSSENDIKHHINDAEMCILEAIEGLGESIGNMEFDGKCNCDLSNYYNMNEIDTMFAELREGDNSEDEEETFLDAVLERDILTEVTIGGIEQDTVLEAGMTFTEFVERLFTLINYGSIGSISSSGTVNIPAPKIIVEIYENGSWTGISSDTTVKENSKVRVRVTDIPKSEFTDIWAGIKNSGNKPNDVLAYGWLKSVNDYKPEYGKGDCEISTKTKITGEDYLTIYKSSDTEAGIFASLKKNDYGKIDMEFTVPASSTNSTTQIGKITVKSNSASYQLQSDNKYEIAAVSSKHTSKPEELDKIPDKRKLTIEENANIGLSKNSSNTKTFVLKVEGWGVVPSKLTTGGTVSINAPEITVYNVTEQKSVSSGDTLNPKHTIRVDVNLNGKSTISGNSASLIKSTDSEFKHGWKKTKGTEAAVTGSGNCEIGTKISHVGDILEFTGTKNGLFNDSDFKIEDNKISFTKTVGNVNSEFSVVAKSGRHQLLADDNYNVYALSSIGSSVKSTNFNNHYSCNKDDVLKTYNAKTSSISRFYFNLLGNPWGYVPEITLDGAVKINAPTIEVKDSNGNKISSGTKLDPRTQLNVTVTIPQHTMSTPISAYYKKSGNNLLYGWQLWSNGTIETEKGIGNCTIVTKTTNTSDKLEITGASGVFAGNNGMSVTNNSSISFNTTASEKSSFTVSAVPSEYIVYPDKDYIIYSLSELGDTDSNNTNTVKKLYTTSSIGKITGNKSSASFSFSLLEELWSKIPTLNISNPNVSIDKPTIKVTKHGETSALNSPVELNPSDTLDIEITLNESKISTTPTAYYQPNESSDYLKYGWKLYKSGTQITSGDNKTKCDIELTTKKDKTTDTHTFKTKTGVFSGLNTSTLKLSNVSVGSTGGTLEITSTPSTYTVSPKYDYRIYALSNFDNFNDEHSAVPGSKQFSGSAQSVSFTYTIKAAQKELFYKIIQSSELGTTLQSANTYNPLTESNLINNLGFTKYTYGNTPVSITGGWCLIMTPLNLSEISAIDALGLDIAITNTNKNIGEYKVYYIQLDKTSTATLKIK
jgi:hypothetical protein